MQQPRRLRYHEAAYPVVECTADIIIMGQLIETFLVSDDGADMYTQLFYLFFIPGPRVEEQVIYFWLRLLRLGIAQAGMNGRPAEHGFYQPFFPVDEDPLSRRDLVIHAAVTFQIDQAFWRNIIDEPADLICMRLDDHFERRFGIDHADRRTIWVCDLGVDIWLQVIEPEPLPAALEADWRGIVDIFSQECK